MNLCIFFKTHTETHRQICIKNYVCTFTHTTIILKRITRKRYLNYLLHRRVNACLSYWSTLVVNSCKIDSFFCHVYSDIVTKSTAFEAFETGMLDSWRLLSTNLKKKIRRASGTRRVRSRAPVLCSRVLVLRTTGLQYVVQLGHL